VKKLLLKRQRKKAKNKNKAPEKRVLWL